MSLLEFLREDPLCRNLAEGAIHAVAPALDDPDPANTTMQLNEWAFMLAGRMPLPWETPRAIGALNDFLFQELAFRGDSSTYDDPCNALLPQVIQRKQGLPITLSILWIDLARRLGLDAVGVALPGHFLAGLRLRGELLCFDPFSGGRPVSADQAARLVHAATAGRAVFQPGMLCPASDRAVLSRLVRNLHRRHVAAEAWDEALWTATHLVLLEPEDPRPRKERALVHIRRHDVAAAALDLQEALRLSPDAAVQTWLEELIRP